MLQVWVGNESSQRPFDLPFLSRWMLDGENETSIIINVKEKLILKHENEILPAPGC